ncbi:MAG: RloB family protein [Bernardetiaceae bacterium]|jgi:hypothetical protein|nr:RloB family protein [Bernardetiaceae bacterium]
MSGKPIKKGDLNKSWNRRSFNPEKAYRREQFEVKRKFLIFCEGENTEPGYFRAFPVASATVETLGLGQGKTSLVKTAIERAKKPDYQGYEVWVVFDFDANPGQEVQQKEDFNRAIALARKHTFQVAYSNDAFELWFLLHFQAVEGQFDRYYFYERLSAFLAVNYEKKGKQKKFCAQLYQCLAEHPAASQDQAIERAKALLARCAHLPPADHNPCTTVFALVEELNKFLKK